MKVVMLYWTTTDTKRKNEVKAELGITSVSVNGESEYKGEKEKLTPYVEEGLFKIRVKEYEQEIRRPKVCFDTIESKPIDRKKTGCGSRARKVRK